MHTPRFQGVDLLRGFAMLWMTGFHFCFDLAQQGFIRQNFYTDPFWTWQRTCILSLFLLCAGMGQAIALEQGQSWQRFGRRWLQIAGCALLVSAGSALMFPNSYIYFGVLHGMALMLIVVRLTAPAGRWLWLLGALALALKPLAAYAIDAELLSTALNGKALNWLGLISRKPITEDFVPLIPWLGVMWWGMALMQWQLKQQGLAAKEAVHGNPARSLPVLLAPIALLGRWSLSYYMLHQPVLLAGLWLWTTLGLPLRS
ncbi:MAG: DUF1624 domain-containing protein [Rhodoferax sp.]|nr:DUF1624 domain-containing protein [Rhodoferax sp.]